MVLVGLLVHTLLGCVVNPADEPVLSVTSPGDKVDQLKMQILHLIHAPEHQKITILTCRVHKIPIGTNETRMCWVDETGLFDSRFVEIECFTT